jgi:prepilin-type N-terminal cleavage/methylation domain-containing protein
MNSRQTGFTLLELLAALAVGTIMLLGMSSMIDTSMDDVKGQQAALYQSAVVDAAKKYLTAHYADLKTLVPVASTPATAKTVQDLIDDHFLSTNFSDKNIYGQSTCLLITQPTAGKLDALVVTYGGNAIPEKDLKMVAMAAGQGGGYIISNLDDPTDNDAGTARGASWSSSTNDYRGVSCDGGAVVLDGTRHNDGGHLASSLFYDGQAFTDFLYRNAYAGRPELNQMNTPIRMANAALVDDGSVCDGTVGGFAIEKTTRKLLTCSAAGTWTSGSSWKDPVANYAALPTTGSVHGDVRMIKDKNVAYTYDGAGWVALAVDKDGNLTVPQDITAGGTITGRYLVASNDLSVGGTADVIGGAHFHQHIQVDGNATADGNLNVGGKADVLGGGHFHQHIQVDQDVNVGNNINMSKDGAKINMSGESTQINMTGNYAQINMPGSDTEINAVDGGFIGQYTSQGHAEIWDHHNPGDRCNFWMTDGHKSWIEFPQGTLLPDKDGVVMSCYGDNTFRYANGTYTP